MGGSGHAKTQQTADWPQWVLPGAQNYLQQYQNVATPGGQLAPYPSGLNQQLAPFNPTQEAALQGIVNTAGGVAPLAGQGGQYASDVLAGKYLNANPYLDAMYNQAARGMVNQYQTATAPSLMAEAARSGAYGTSAFDQQQALQQYGLGQNLTDLATQLYGGNYAQGIQNQLSVLGGLPSTMQAQFMPAQQVLGAGTLEQQQAQSGLDINFQNALRQQQYPYQTLDQLGQALGTAAGPAYSSNTIVPIKSGYMGFK